MEKNTNKLVRKPNNFLGLILFTIIYFLVQVAIYPVLAYLFWFIFTLFSTGILLEAPEQILKIFVIVFLLFCLIIILGIMYFLGYLCKRFLKKMNKKALILVMIVILIYFVFRAIFENKYSSIMSRLTNGRKYIFCILSHVSFIIGVFYSDKVKKILDKIKFKRK